ncbi:carbon-nitrogen hydrolase [Ampelomyces quisqualis]|uniref:Carbon-nitrogen hydrolase n=1 Tax=Ampelomyces quisqualis TaxID=50730 RepID=A0A6A5QB51_AMPQU|nr:carbon-nitrogen hydrolase [Ampelomyces quisqualis]
MPLAAIGQMCSTASMGHNLSQCQKLVQKASEAGAKALFLPEACDYIGSRDLCKPVESSEFVLGVREEAKKYKLPVHVGIHEPAAGKKVKNTLIWIDEHGDITQRYQKLHLFDVDIENGPSLKESDNVERGHQLLQPFSTALGKIGSLICFDMRFPEPAQALRARGAHIITYPSAFTSPTGKAGHWEILLRARAIETQSYVIAAGQVGVHDEEGKRRSYGTSMIIDPWGKIVSQLGGDDGEDGHWKDEGEIAVAEIDLEYVDKIRRELPLVRRTDVYPEIK